MCVRACVWVCTQATDLDSTITNKIVGFCCKGLKSYIFINVDSDYLARCILEKMGEQYKYIYL